MKPKFEYPDPTLSVSKLAYDLSLIYARTKFVEQLKADPKYFSRSLAPAEVEELDFLEKNFLLAYDYYTSHEPGDLERIYLDSGE